jgi:16S rRNA (guanine966-N2)-methyltransferase
VRIIAGNLGGRRLIAPAGHDTRPTSDRVREAMFSMLESARHRQGAEAAGLEGARVLDLYAGSGALGLEALSRGAAHAVFVEQARPALASLETNLRSLGVESRATVLAASVERSLERIAALGPFDVALVDPPYALLGDGRAARALGALVERGVLAEAGLLVLEHASRDEPPSLPVVGVERSRRYGDTTVTAYARRHEAPVAEPSECESSDDG